jgi:hypothetical protein
LEFGSLLSLFSFQAAIPSFASPKQPKSPPLESINYESQNWQALYFDIHPN